MERSISLLNTYQIGVRLNFSTFSPESFSEEALHKVWEAHRDSLDATGEIHAPCSVHLQDWDRIVAFLAHLDRIDEDVLEQMRGKVIFLNMPELGLSTASPYSAMAIRRGFSFEVTPNPVPGSNLLAAKLTAAVDEAQVRAVIVEIKKRIKEYNVMMEEADYKLANNIGEKKYALESQHSAKRMRFTAAQAWKMNADALGDGQEIADAQAAINAYLVHTNYIQQAEEA